ncbi:hypothetical protein MUK42_32582 [Musa troglodytarum]|uniref:Uncharacterized protein n=1 Tax=Musa troglodytarum TaxID=320322 RepID=A0A9E7JLK8_9LILI|nr:hypothetical protein MUK42_32582 [Musa troglodytarum]
MPHADTDFLTVLPPGSGWGPTAEGLQVERYKAYPRFTYRQHRWFVVGMEQPCQQECRAQGDDQRSHGEVFGGK